MRWGLLLVLAAAGESAAKPSLAQIAPLHRERQAVILETYRAALGRDPTAGELTYWEQYPDTPPGVVSRHTLFAALRQTLRNSLAERAAAARRALDLAFAREVAASPPLRGYIENTSAPPMQRAVADLAAGRGGGGYRGLLAWLSDPAFHRFFALITGIDAMRAKQRP